MRHHAGTPRALFCSHSPLPFDPVQVCRWRCAVWHRQEHTQHVVCVCRALTPCTLAVVAHISPLTVLLPFVLFCLSCAVRGSPQLDAKDTEIKQLQEELQAAKDYSRVCEDESVELRRQLFDMTKQMKKLNKEFERMTAERAAEKQQLAQSPAAPASSKCSSTRKTMGDSAMACENGTSSDAGSDSAPFGGDHSMEDASAPRRSTRRAGLRPDVLSMTAVEAKPKRKASARAAAASPESERPAPASSKKKRVAAEHAAAAAAASAAVTVCGGSSAESEGEKEKPKPVAREERALGESRQVTGGAGGMGEHPDPLTEEEQAPAAPPGTENEQRELLIVLGEANLQLQAGWLPRMRALQQLKMLLTSPGLLKCDQDSFVEQMLPALVVQTSDARSQIVREACSLITEIMPFLSNYHANVAHILLPQLWKLTYVCLQPPHHHTYARSNHAHTHVRVRAQTLLSPFFHPRLPPQQLLMPFSLTSSSCLLLPRL